MKIRKDVGRLIKIISIKLKRILDNKLGDITDIQMFILDYLYHNQEKKEIYQKDIESILEVRRSTTTEILNIMEKNGFIMRNGSCNDKRKKIIVLTEKGINYIVRFQKVMVEVENSLLKDISDEDLKVFFMVAEKLKDNINKMEDDVC